MQPGDHVKIVNPLTYYYLIGGIISGQCEDGGWFVDLDYQTDKTFAQAIFEEWELDASREQTT